jgi:hypothetical protein
VFSITPGKPDRGTLFDYGADFYHMAKVGRAHTPVRGKSASLCGSADFGLP